MGQHTDDFFRTDPRPEGTELPPKYEPIKQFGSMIKYPGSETMLMVNHEYTVEEAEALLRNNEINLVTFARPFIYNPVRVGCSALKRIG